MLHICTEGLYINFQSTLAQLEEHKTITINNNLEVACSSQAGWTFYSRSSGEDGDVIGGFAVAPRLFEPAK